MKNYLLLLLLLLSFASMAQSDVPFKNASTIEVITSLGPEVAYKTLAQVLQKNGYGVASSDAVLGTITTTAKSLRNSQTTLHTSIQGDSTAVIVLSGSYHALDSDSPIIYKGAKGSIMMNAWKELENIAKALPYTSIKYR